MFLIVFFSLVDLLFFLSYILQYICIAFCLVYVSRIKHTQLFSFLLWQSDAILAILIGLLILSIIWSRLNCNSIEQLHLHNILYPEFYSQSKYLGNDQSLKSFYFF